MKGSLVKLSIGILMMFVLAACNTDNANNENHENPNISSISTDQSSSEYPHTQPIKTQDAKYEAREDHNKTNSLSVVKSNVNKGNKHHSSKQRRIMD